jgi:hypothetical protein
LETGKASVTVIEKPFFLPEMLLKQKIAQGLDTLWNKLASGGHREGVASETPDASVRPTLSRPF